MKDVTVQWLYCSWWWVAVLLGCSMIGCILLQWFYKRKIVDTLTSPSRRFLLHRYSSSKMMLKELLLIASVILLLAAALRPQRLGEALSVEQRGRDIIIALDISRSMLAADLEPSRLEWAKHKIKKLLTLLGADRVSLLLFAGSCYVQCPLTTDFDTFTLFLEGVDQTAIGSGSTSIALALQKALQIVEQKKERTNTVLLLVTDGEDYSSDLESYKTRAAANALHIVTLGIGSTYGAPIPIIDAKGAIVGYEKDENNTVVISTLHEPTLQALAQQTGGLYVKSTASDDDLLNIQEYINGCEKDVTGPESLVQWQEWYHPLVIIALLLLLMEWLL